ncbi:MAG: GntR family transcriptional regulator [Planctomycetota bacterium]
MTVTTSTTKHGMILEQLLKELTSGLYQPGDRLPADAEFVERFNASRPTVAKALQELERRGLVVRRPGSGTFVREDGEAAEGEKLFGLLIPGLGDTEIFEPICAEMARLAHESHHSLLWGNSPPRDANGLGSTALQLCKQYIKRGVDGVFFAPLELTRDKDRVNRQIIKALDDSHTPVILLDRDYLPYPSRSEHDLVGIDNRRIGFAVTEHLFEQGCKNVVFCARPHSANTIDARSAGFVESVLHHTGTYNPKQVQRIDPDDVKQVEVLVKKIKPDGVVCGNDITAAHLMRTLDNMGVKVPDELLVTGVDDVKYAELLRVPLTTMHQHCEAIGQAAFHAMLERMQRPDAPARDILLDCKLVPRDSTSSTKKP